MTSVLLLMSMLCFCRLAAVYDEELLFPGFVNVSERTSKLLVSGVLLPMSKTPNPPDNRRKLAVAGLILYALTAACILQCVYNGLTLEPIESLEYTYYSHRGGVITETSTEELNGNIAISCFCFEALVYLANSCRFFVKRAGTSDKKIAVGTVVLVLAVLAAIFLAVSGRTMWDSWQKIRSAMG